MRAKFFMFLIIVFVFIQIYARVVEGEKVVIKGLILEAYVGGVFNDDNTEAMKKGFHENFTMQIPKGNEIEILTLDNWMKGLEKWKSNRKGWNNRTNADIIVIGISGNAAVAQIKVYENEKHIYTDFMSLLKFPDGWKITNKIYTEHK